ncbi:class I SAM-dependent methyltransferase [Campylobacter sp. RM16187]|uniref:class I SAM-dependent methyltransferase n=1 Tax=Campylobacter sp. RM16187 TaxID=1660063 RepID=UPI0021B6CF7E|nr:class I SAM-dependent methyltransferase [Campylobacter sp. RM16187]QKG29406.1 leucine carboxyl methyltransferase family protein [Campylobacter sp. RM16187]
MQKISFNDGISETLLINLYFRSLENEVKEPILKDEFSKEIVKSIDYDFAKFDSSDLSRVGVVIRAKFIDDALIEFAKKYDEVVIVQVGAGLDTRPLRLEAVCPNATFYDLDLPDVIALRDKLMPKAKKNFSIASSMLETAWMDELKAKHPNAKFAFALEGVSMYFEKEVFKEFVLNLAKRFEGIVALDLINKFTANMDSRKHDTLKFMKKAVVFKMGIEDPSEVEEWDKTAIKHLKTGTMMDKHKNRWSLRGRIFGLIPAFRNSCRMFVFKIN